MRRRQVTKRDDNHVEIVSALEAIGVGVHDMASAGNGMSDLLCAKNGTFFLIEVKDGRKPPSARPLTPDQVKFHAWAASFGCTVHVVTNVHEAIAIFQEPRP